MQNKATMNRAHEMTTRTTTGPTLPVDPSPHTPFATVPILPHELNPNDWNAIARYEGNWMGWRDNALLPNRPHR